MMYTSLKFVMFSMAILMGYYVFPHKFRSFFMLAANFYFCSLFGVKHLFVLIASTLFSFLWAKLLQKTKSKALLTVGVTAVAGSLFLIKFGTVFGMSSILVPIGYSFYSLQMISFLMDIYQGKIFEFDLISFAQYMTFFPLLLQGPICRYQKMQEEFKKKTSFDFQMVKSGALLMMFGFFKKLVIADRLAIYTSDVFTNYTGKSGGVILLAVVFYAFQLYTDFSGCTDISRGVSECLGISLPVNFNNPYFSLSIKEFWNRWHISLSNWLKDYVYIPLGGNRKGTLRKYINLFLTFVVSGLWHGTGLQYLIWGGLQAFGQVLEGFFEKWFRWYKRLDNLLVHIVRRCYVTLFTLGSWLVFRAHGVRAALFMALKIMTGFFSFAGVLECGLDQKDLILSFVLIFGLLVVDLVREKKKDIRLKINSSYVVQCLVFMILIFGIFVFGIYGSGYSASDFIYMQF